ncbi:diguanylate cyclase [bacterium]|nr:diguanylate cyclase [bacterium]
MKKFFWGPEARLSIGIFFFFAIFTFLGFNDGLELKTLDLRFQLRPPQRPSTRLIILDISDDCIEKLGKWPWPRSYHAKAVDFLRKAGASLIIFDVLFPEKSKVDSTGDDEFVASCKEFSRVLLPTFISQVNVFNDPGFRPLKIMELRKPFDSLASVALGLGFINFDYRNLNPDGIVRRLPLGIPVNKKNQPSLCLAAAQAELGLSSRFTQDRLLLGEKVIPLVSVPNFSFQDFEVDFKPSYLVNFLGDATSGVFPVLPYSDLVNGLLDPSFFKEKVILIGPSATGLSDIKLTPYGEMPGVMIQANLIQNLLSENHLFNIEPFPNLAILFTLSILIVFILTNLKPFQAVLAILFTVFSYNFVSIVLFLKGNFVLEMLTPSLLMVSQFTILSFWGMFSRLKSAYQTLKESSSELEVLNRSLDQKVLDLSTLQAAGTRFASLLDMDILSREVLKTFLELGNGSRGLIVSQTLEGEPLQTIASEGFEGENIGIILYEQAVSANIGKLFSGRAIIHDPDCLWFSHFLPLTRGPYLWGAILVKQSKPELFSTAREKFWSTLLSISATALENARLYNLATVDLLTRLFVRRYFQIYIDQEYKRARRFKHSFTLLMTDIDHFKLFNDRHGHQQGDLVLKEVAGAVKRSLREMDIPARYGGEEFSIILPETDLNGGLLVADRIRKSVETLHLPRIDQSREDLRVTISIGIASFPEHEANSTEELIKLADEALYRAKNTGRNRVNVAALNRASYEVGKPAKTV